jgi:tRNA U34 5-methylaminomethyl-2-thiouridine-forming methyltransferase MnmC
MHDQTPVINWIENGVPFSQMFNDPFYSTENGIDETLHVFLNGNGLPERFCDGFQVAELGFGTGLNMLVSINEFIRSNNKGKLKYIVLRLFPFPLTR